MRAYHSSSQIKSQALFHHHPELVGYCTQSEYDTGREQGILGQEPPGANFPSILNSQLLGPTL